MKNLIFSMLFMSSIIVVNAQSDVIKTTKVKKTPHITENGMAYNTKVKVVTEKSKRTKFNPNQKYDLNQNRVDSPVTVEKTIMIDNDTDPFYDTKTTVKFFKYKGKKYDFLFGEDNILITYKLKDKDITSAKAIKSINNNFYIIEGKDFNGTGYFNKYGDFVIEFINKKTKKVEYKLFETFKL